MAILFVFLVHRLQTDATVITQSQNAFQDTRLNLSQVNATIYIIAHVWMSINTELTALTVFLIIILFRANVCFALLLCKIANTISAIFWEEILTVMSVFNLMLLWELIRVIILL